MGTTECGVQAKVSVKGAAESPGPVLSQHGARAVIEADPGVPGRNLNWRYERTIRHGDPRLSCSTHGLDLAVERE